MISRRTTLGLLLSTGAAALVRPARAGSSRSADSTARWLAGLSTPPDGDPGPEWKTYAHAENERWEATLRRVSAMRTWATRELVPVLPSDPTLFYPFAGPDALHALALFPTATRIVLVGLEPVGFVPDPDKPPAGLFARLARALADIHRLTFFRTHEMKADFQREGVMPALLATVARMGGTVSSVHMSANRARIEWTENGAVRRLDYVQADLANSSDGSSVAAPDVLPKAPYVTFVKAAMHLLREPRFSATRQRILDDSSIVLQDDTGIPFKAFDERWALRFYGRYDVPAPPFEERLQPALRAAFEQRGSRPLPFGIGYPISPNRSNLILASKGGL